MEKDWESSEDELEFITVAQVGELLEGDRIFLEIDGEIVALFNIEGDYFAIQDLCSHDDGPVAEGEIIGHEIECPRHGALFDLRTGEALSLPAVVDIPSYPVRVIGNDIQIAFPLDEEG
jgi:3-phenylpropionate/trans-cinnamate dioxygenase ferredoxin subunit